MQGEGEGGGLTGVGMQGDWPALQQAGSNMGPENAAGQAFWFMKKGKAFPAFFLFLFIMQGDEQPWRHHAD